MKATEHFERVIKTYLEHQASKDKLFAVTYMKTNKNLDDCISYILGVVQESGCNGFLDDEIFSMAIHYYEEDDIKVGVPNKCKILVNHLVELTEKEKEQARKNAIKRMEDEAYEKMTRTKNKIQ